MQIETGSAEKLGALYDGRGVNFAVFSAHAARIELCLFDADGKTETARIILPQKTGDIWHGYIPGLAPGQVYGYRAYGPDDPAAGHKFNPNKLLLDPYAREVTGKIEWTDAHTDPKLDNADVTLKARVTAPVKKAHTQKPDTPWADTVIYEMHAKGFTMTDPAVPPALRGTFDGLAQDSVIEYIKSLGVSAVEFLPVQAKVDEPRLDKLGLKNYWGYNTIGFFAPEPSLGGRQGLRDTIDKLHAAGVEVIFDIVFNHSGEGDHTGPTLSFRGLDNASYYKLHPHDKSKYTDETGCGNTLDIANPNVRRMVLDSLRYWVDEFGVDGFRFDLAPVLARDPAFNQNAAFFREIAADPVLSKVKMIAEPWDVGHGGYQLGNFPAGWHEWNDRFRDDVRKFWRGDAGMVGHKATRLAGSSPEFDHSGRQPFDTINMVASHDGFTLHDVVSYDTKHNHANGEQNRDGHGTNYSSNYGVEGDTDNPAIIEMRERQKRNLLASLFLSQGTPMILAGDEHGNTQHGNNNAYCQDNATGWLKWDKLTAEGKRLTDFVRKLVSFRKKHPSLRADHFLHGHKTSADGMPDIAWYAPSGRETTTAEWNSADNRCLGMFLNDEAASGSKGGERLLAIFNSHSHPVDFRLPDLPSGSTWQRVLDTSAPELDGGDQKVSEGHSWRVPEKSVVVFVHKS